MLNWEDIQREERAQSRRAADRAAVDEQLKQARIASELREQERAKTRFEHRQKLELERWGTEDSARATGEFRAKTLIEYVNQIDRDLRDEAQRCRSTYGGYQYALHSSGGVMARFGMPCAFVRVSDFQREGDRIFARGARLLKGFGSVFHLGDAYIKDSFRLEEFLKGIFERELAIEQVHQGDLPVLAGVRAFARYREDIQRGFRYECYYELNRESTEDSMTRLITGDGHRADVYNPLSKEVVREAIVSTVSLSFHEFIGPAGLR